MNIQALYDSAAAIGRRLGARRVVLFGSRARGDHHAQSDVDLAVYGAPSGSYTAFCGALEELPTLLSFDLVYVTERTDSALRGSIERDGVILMSRFKEKYEKLRSAVDRLDEALADFDRTPLLSIRDGVMQRFEFCAELSWKTVREYLLDLGYETPDGPKPVMRLAYRHGFLREGDDWIALLTARNLTSHLYDEAQAQEIFDSVQTTFAPMLRSLVDTLRDAV